MTNIFVPDHSRNVRPRVEFHSRPLTECTTQGGIPFPTTHGMRDPGWNFIPDHSRNVQPRVEFHSQPPTECATQGGISSPTTHGMRDPGWNFIPDHPRSVRPRVEFHSRPPAEWNFEVSFIRRHIKNGGIQTFPPLSIINIQKRAENLIVKPAAINHVVYRLIDKHL